jgi:uncharacterized protein (TIGR02444 family)
VYRLTLGRCLRRYSAPQVVNAHMSSGETKATGSPFWQFSLGFYGRAGVADACIALQDQCGVDVNLLLFLLWLAMAKRQLSLGELYAIEQKSRAWSRMVVGPLRTVRRTLKTGSELVAPASAETFRAGIKAVELEAERIEQEALYAFSQNPGLGRSAELVEDAARANVKIYESIIGREFTKNAVDVLLRAINDVQGGS